MENPQFQKKSFWRRPEGITGMIFMAGLLIGGGYLLYTFLPAIILLTQNVLYLSLLLIALAAILYMVFDPKMRNLIWYMYKSVMRSLTGVFVNIDPIGILKSYVEDLENNLRKMSRQIGNLRGQMRKLKTIMQDNEKEIDNNMKLASMARRQDKESQVILASRKAARLKETNQKYAALHQKMEIMYRILDKMYRNSEILLEDTKDQVAVKEQERKAIRTSHSAMKSAMSVMSGDPDKRAMFDMAMEQIADDVANKVGEMERFMEVSSNFMDSIDLQNGVFEEEGLKMLEKWEKESTLMLLDGKSGKSDEFDLDAPRAEPQQSSTPKTNTDDNKYDQLFEG